MDSPTIKDILIDAGCDQCTIDKYMQCTCNKQKIDILSQHRQCIMDNYHKECKKVDCLDYLICNLKTGEK